MKVSAVVFNLITRKSKITEPVGCYKCKSVRFVFVIGKTIRGDSKNDLLDATTGQNFLPVMGEITGGKFVHSKKTHDICRHALKYWFIFCRPGAIALPVRRGSGYVQNHKKNPREINLNNGL